MDIIQSLREYVLQLSEDKLSGFLDILQNVESSLSKQQESAGPVTVRCINLEGLDGAGKTVLAYELSRLNGFAQLPDSVSGVVRDYRCYFDSEDESIKRKFYYFCNLVISEYLRNSDTSAVPVLDRYWPSTIAYQLAHQRNLEVTDDDLRWPPYMVIPSHVIYLNVEESIRQERIRRRSMPITAEEIQLEDEPEFRSRLTDIYLRIPGIQKIDASGSLSETVKIITQLLDTSSSSC